MRRVVGGEANRHAITRDHAYSESTHSAGELGRHLLAVLERDLIAATAENFVDATGRLNQVISRQIESILPTLDRVQTSSSAPDQRLAPIPQRTRRRACRIDGPTSPDLEVRAG